MMLLGVKEGKKLLRFIRTLPLKWGWSREHLAAKLTWLMSPSKDDDSPEAQELREYLGGYQVNIRGATLFMNREPFCSMLQLGVAFDRFLDACHRAKVEPFQLEQHVHGLNRSVIGKWCGGLEYPRAPIRENLNRLLQQKIGMVHPINLFRRTSDNELIRSGYLVDTRSKMERNSHGGDRQFGTDPLLRISNLGASWPMYRYLHRDIGVLVGFWGEPAYHVKIPDTRKYISKCAYFAERRWQMFKDVKRYSTYANKFLKTADKIANQESW